MWTLRTIKILRSLRRRFFGKRLPHWLKDAVGLIKYINLLRLVPTLHMIICKPAHFFKCIPAILVGKKPYYLSPLQFVTNLAVLQILVIPYFFSDSIALNKEEMIVCNLSMAILSPILIACACLVILTLWLFCTHIWPLNIIAHELPFNYHGTLIPLSPQTYVSLDWGRYFWSLFYFYLYFYFALMLVGAPLVAGEVAVWDVYASIGDTIYINKITVIPFACIALFAAIIGYWVFVRPYILLLLASARFITPRMLLFMYVDTLPS